MKKILLLGATGSVGMQTLDVINYHSKQFQLVGFSFGNNIDLARQIIKDHHPKLVHTASEAHARRLQQDFPKLNISYGDQALSDFVLADYDLLVNAIVGSIGLSPTMAAIRNGRDVAIANKETLVVAGDFIMQAAQIAQVQLLPVDSEHAAIFQVLQGIDRSDVRKLMITASGGALRDLPRSALADVTLSDVLAHPNWSMGAKITVDSATMVNKGLEVIEAHHLFNMPYDGIETLLHRESVIHSMITLKDGAILAQMGASDMREPIQYALSYPRHLAMGDEKPFELTKLGRLHFEALSLERFPMLDLAYQVGKQGGGYPAVYNAANEVANQAFRAGQISFLAIERLINEAVDQYRPSGQVDFETLIAVDQETRQIVREWL